MIPSRTPSRRGKTPKMAKNIERLYKEGKCSECSVLVTRMDFAKILGRFTKVKIQYESSSPKPKRSILKTSPNSNARLKSNENGMVLIPRNAYNQHPVAELLNKKIKGAEKPSRINNTAKSKSIENTTPKRNVLKENNRLKRTPAIKNNSSNYVKKSINLKRYGIIFANPTNGNNNIEHKSKLSLLELLPSINKTILPSEDWCIDFLPKDEEPKEDKVYDRIAAELEDLMYNEKSTAKTGDKNNADNKEEFPSIMDILNENTTENNHSINQSNPIIQTNLESSDVEAMLLGKPSESQEKPVSSPMGVDNSVMNNAVKVVQMDTSQESKTESDLSEFDNPHSPSILDETLQKGVEEHLPKVSTVQETPTVKNPGESKTTEVNIKISDSIQNIQTPTVEANTVSITHVVFKKRVNGEFLKSVTCPKNLKYTVELHGKSVEFLGAPKFISSPEDLQVLLQIVNETELNNLYVLH